jgi:hypothetical protein
MSQMPQPEVGASAFGVCGGGKGLFDSHPIGRGLRQLRRSARPGCVFLARYRLSPLFFPPKPMLRKDLGRNFGHQMSVTAVSFIPLVMSVGSHNLHSQGALWIVGGILESQYFCPSVSGVWMRMPSPSCRPPARETSAATGQ